MKALDMWARLKAQVSPGDRAEALQRTPEHLQRFYSKLPRRVRVYLMALYLFVKNESFTKSAPAVAALLYFVMPVDVMPDFLPLFGFADDIAVLQFVFRYLRREIKPYLTDAEREIHKMDANLDSGPHAEGDNLH